MNKKTKYYFLITRLVSAFIMVLIIGALIKIIAIYQYIDPSIFSVIKITLHVINTLLIVILCLGGIYLIYQIYYYRSSAFYRDYKINVVEALSHGIVDMHLIYDKVKKIADSKIIKIDFSNNIIVFSIRFKYYSILFVDLFGKIDGKETSDYWYTMRKPQKKYGRTIYANMIRFFNPIIFNQKYASELNKETGSDYIDYVVLTGFYHLEFTHRKIISPYEILSIVDK